MLYVLILISFFFIVSYFAIPQIIKFSINKKLLDVPDHRKVHKILIPALGGVAVFICFVLSFIVKYDHVDSSNLWILIAASSIVVTGIIDDIRPLRAILKLGVQLIAAMAVVYFGGYAIHSFSGTFGISALPYWVSFSLSVFLIILLVNAQNLIDGVNGLCALLGVLFFTFFAIYFYSHSQIYFTISIAFLGSLLAFLRYNLIKPQIFLGDTGSTLIGFVAAVFMIQFLNDAESVHLSIGINQPYGILLCLFAIPIFDTFRVAGLRLLKQKSPFSPDKTHIHHIFLRLGFEHYHISLLLILVNIVLVIAAYFLQNILGDTLIVAFLIGAFVFGFFILEFFIVKKFKMRYTDTITLEKFRNFVAEYWYLFFSIIVFVLPYQRWATSLPLVVYAIFWVFSLKLDHIKWRTIPVHTVLIPGVLFIFPLVYYVLFDFNIGYGLKTAIRMSPFILFPIFLFLKKEFFSLKKWYSILAFYLLGVLSFSSILFVIQFIKYFAGLQDYFNIRTETTISNIPTIYFSLLICFALMTVMYLVKSEIKLLQNRLIQVLLLSFLSCIMLAIHSKVGFVAMILILSIGGAIQFKQYRKISAGLIVAAALTLYSVLFIFQSDKMNLSHLTNSSIEVTKRIHQWKSGIYLFQNNPLMGYGSDYRAHLSNISSNHLNAHNQFLELAIEYGLFGIFALLLLLIYGISQAIKSRDYFFLGFIVLVAYYACFESIFTSQTGIIFVSIFLTLFLLKTRLRIKTIDENSLSS